jgi:hypothetical protein
VTCGSFSSMVTRYIQTFEIFAHLQPNEAGAYDGRRLRALRIDKSFDAVHVVDRTQGENMLRVRALYRGNDSPGAGRDDELIVLVGKNLARGEILDGYAFFSGRDRKRLVPRMDVHVVFALKERRVARVSASALWTSPPM